jgi:DNA-binding FrmR family transcriptional regulator
MSHPVKEKAKLLMRVKRVRGQVDALERALDSVRPNATGAPKN